jgi:hypothetical protein
MFRKEREVAVAVRGEAEGSWPLFIGAGRRWKGRTGHVELTRPSMAVRKNISPLTRPARPRPEFVAEE